MLGSEYRKDFGCGSSFSRRGPHLHWHIDVSYINVGGSFFYLCSIQDGYSRFIVHWDLRAQMTELDIECILQAAREKFPAARPRIISDNGPQFIAKDFKVFMRLANPGDQAEARRLIARYVEEYNQRRLHSALGYIAPRDKLQGRDKQIWELRDQRLAAARELRRQRRQQQRDREQRPHNEAGPCAA